MLLMYSYHSTDFQVHRNWLAITSSLDISKWYFENTSEWTLDYPPFFAYFERGLGIFARFFDSEMLVVDNLEYRSNETILFQRASVIVTEIVYFVGAFQMVQSLSLSRTRKLYLFGLVVCIPGLLFVDHIHFQYNGFMYGIQLLSLTAFYQDQHLVGGLLFAVLLNFKHIYLYQAPAYFIFILSSFCFSRQGFQFMNLIKMGFIVVAVFGISFFPFRSHIPQVISRLFPFKRGLCHAYWAPNVWALYSFADRTLILCYKLLGRKVATTAHLTRGLVGDSTFSVLPNVTPGTTVALTLLSQLPILWVLWKKPNAQVFIKSLVLTGFGSFLFGWHVHEKAILMVLIPLAFMIPQSPIYAKMFTLLNIIATYSLFPLIFEKNELITKTLVLLAYWSASQSLTRSIHDWRWNTAERIYTVGIVFLHIYDTFLHTILFQNRLEFLPLMLTSVYSAVGMVYAWILIYTSDK